MSAKPTIIMIGIQGKAKQAQRAFETYGLSVTFYAVQRYEPFPEEKLVQQLDVLPEQSWLVFSSSYAVKLLRTIKLRRYHWWQTARIVAVGNTTRRAVEKYFPRKTPEFTVGTFQEALTVIRQSGADVQRVIHLTSLQSFANLTPDIPENVLLHRIPIYQLQVNKKLGGRVPEPLQRDNVYLVVPSPSAINAAVELWGKQFLKPDLKVFTLGKTTAEYVYTHYHMPEIYFPGVPELEQVARLIVEMTKTPNSQEIV